ncbi:MAG: TolC family protein [Candidatus Acidiferrales bacterium]
MTGSLSRSAMALFVAGMLVVAPVYGQSQGQSQSGAPGQTQDQSQSQTQTGPKGQTPSQPSGEPQNPAPATAPLSQAEIQARDLKTQMGPNYSSGKAWFPNFISPYTPINIELPVLTNSPRVTQLIQNGKLPLSLEDAISLALENNLDIRIQRFTPWIAQTDLLRAKAGGVARGLGAAANVVLGSTPTFGFDPLFSSTISWNRSAFPVNNPFTSGVGTTATVFGLTNYTTTANFAYQQGFHTGTAVSLAFDNVRSSSNSPQQLFNPAVQSTLAFNVQQQLLNGFGLLPNTRFILEAKNTLKVADLQFALQVITSLQQVENFYWELVFARQNVKVQEAAVATSQRLYEDNKKQVEIGTLAPIEIVRAESQLATDRQNQIVAQTAQLQQQTNLMNAITKNPLDASLVGVEIVPTTPITAIEQEQLLPLEDAVKEAWEHRPEILQAELNLKNAGIEVKTTKNALLPTLTLFGQYSATGLAGNRIAQGSATSFVADPAQPIVDANGNIVAPPVFVGVPTAFSGSTIRRTGLSEALDSMIKNDFPTYGAGINLTLPIRNRSAQADNARALLDERQLQTQYRQLQNTIIVDVRNAEIALQQDRARVEAAVRARILAQETLDAERKKYQLGASTTFIVIQDQRDLTLAQGNELRAQADLQEAQVAYDKARGRLLDVNHITVADARGGHIYRSPLIPGMPDLPEPTNRSGGN